MHALIGSYKPEGHDSWMNEIKIFWKYWICINDLKDYFRGVKFSPQENTYMLFLDFTLRCLENSETIEEIKKSSWKGE